ncbi:hypothetical protein [Pantoea sp. 18069]|uniref:hypothetical protein n=1 Tax=Pantoea sp. 18069 TaxID=2681415 RepID=UPI001359262F|nr:hypothetical protein [Pantoea sp. 18069]
MKNALKILSVALLATSLMACGGGDDNENTADAGGSGGSSNTDGSGGADGSGGSGSGLPAGTLVAHSYFSRDFSGTRQVELDLQIDSATTTLGSDTFTYTYNTAAGTWSASDGYSLIGGLADNHPGVQVCKDGESAHVVLPANAQPATLEDLKGKTLTWYEDCKVSDGTGEDPLPSSVTFASDGSLEVKTTGQTETEYQSPENVAALLSDSGFADDSGTTRLFAYKVGERPVVVHHNLSEEIITTWVYEPGN